MAKRAIVAGHLCLDIIPLFENPPSDPAELFSPGHLFSVQSTLYSTGGAVANTGGALESFGIETTLIGRVGEDGFGAEIERILRRNHPGANLELKRVSDEGSSYSIILTSPQFDRIFFHSPGVNDTFTSFDVTDADFSGRDLIHFGYPPAMRASYENDGEELVRLFSRAKTAGLTTSLDLSYPQAGSRAAAVEWPTLLERVLPHVDLFLPGLEELRLMLTGPTRPLGGALSSSRSGFPKGVGAESVGLLEQLRETSLWALSKGCAVCVLKIGAEGLYVRSSDDPKRIRGMGSCSPKETKPWTDRELLEPCFDVEPAGTTGAGDVTIAGFLAAVLRGSSIEDATRMALAAGASCVERVDAAAGLPSWEGLSERVDAGWKRVEPHTRLQGEEC